MAKLKLVYFKGCPNYLPALELLQQTGEAFEAVCQDELGAQDSFKNFSSPTLLKGNEIVFGALTRGGGCSVDLPSLERLKELIKNNQG